ncbi:glutaredoxin 3 [Thiohalophilus thiocyanatoxydans]|uniref:Glutaredoxin n=1 Tax=Thiohalophilus thiocyanatoxydans TaxID=381308 RepID=A0A4R8IS78_9GAMM|nr:glutaredoxin 3 [Thiohalophilus thiocyanatoxydans]TDY03816.1 glutaredoxin 3 [Thiohalophilus thiocyanatoxydans]
MAEVTIYTTQFCPYCVRAKRLLDSKQVSYDEIPVDADSEQRQIMMERSQGHTVPQIFIDDQHVGGCDELYALEAAGQLDSRLGLNNT